jgi:DNA repair protein RecO (recombination protein O)
MIVKTRGIVIKTTKYSETSLVVRVFTENFGMRTYLVRGVRKKKSRTPLNLFQPLSLIDMLVYEKVGRDLQNAKEIKANYIFSSIPYEMSKSSIVIFLNELIYKAIREEETNIELFHFLYHSLIYLDEVSSEFQNFHLHFALRLTRFLGFEPSYNYLPRQETFDLQEGRYSSAKLPEGLSITPPLSELFYLLSKNSEFGSGITMKRLERQALLNKLIQYYHFHLPGFDDMKSIDILQEVLS